MSQKFVLIDVDGETPIAYYDDAVHSVESIPPQAIPITDAQYNELWTQPLHLKRFDGVNVFTVAETISPEMIKAEANRRIVTVLPEWKQRNYTARMIELDRKDRLEGLTASEQTEMDALLAIWEWVKTVRAASDALEQSLPADYTDDTHWPTPLA